MNKLIAFLLCYKDSGRLKERVTNVSETSRWLSFYDKDSIDLLLKFPRDR